MFPLMAIGAGLSIAGAATSFFGSQDANEASKAAIAAQQRMEATRMEAMKFDADQKRRQAIREMIMGRSIAAQRGANQGANSSGSSALPGAYGQVVGRAGTTISGINTNLAFGQDMFEANQQLLAAKSQMADAQQTMQMGSSLSSLGGSLMGAAGSFDRVFSGFGGTSGPALGATGPSWFGNSGRDAFYGQ